VTKFVELLISGISLGAVYSLIALGFVVIYKSTEVVSFVHGSLLLLGGYLVARLDNGLGFLGALVVATISVGALAVVIEVLLIRPLRRRGTDPVAASILTIGVDIILLTELTRRIGANVLGLRDPWGSKVVSVGGYVLPQARLAAIVVSLLLVAGFLLATKYTGWGIAMRASAEDGEASALMGIRRGRVSAICWLIAGVLAAVASIFLTAFPAPGLDNTTGLGALKAFPAAILAGLDSTTGVLVGGLAIGLAETFTSGYENHLDFLGRGIGSVMPWIVMLLVLLIRPSGLFGTKEATRV
jgi:branched-chain amino acid transport system permease protein